MKKQLAFYIPYLVFVLTFVILMAVNTKAHLHLWMTSFYCPLSDTFFRYYTYVGDWIPYAVIGLMLFYHYRSALFVLATQLLSGLISQIIKHLVSEDRPLRYFQHHFPDIRLHQVAGEHLHSVHSFPSGHTVTAFAFFLSLSYLTKSPLVQFIYFILAFLVGFSRIYLSQHFAIDVLAGSIIGVSVVLLSWIYFNKQPMQWANGSLLNAFCKKKRANSLLSEI